MEMERSLPETIVTAAALVKAKGEIYRNGLKLLYDHVLSDEESRSFGNVGIKTTTVLEGEVSERTVSDLRLSQKRKELYEERQQTELSPYSAGMGKSGKKELVYVGSWDSVAGKMKYTFVEKGQAYVQLERDPSFTSCFPRVCLEEHVPPDFRRKSSQPSKVATDHAVPISVAT
jgi:hypothetical protein